MSDTSTTPDPPIRLEDYSRALDEIYRLRRALAYEAAVTVAHLGYATFPKSRRKIAEKQIERMKAAARGEAARSYAETSSLSLRSSMREAGAPDFLTRNSWEQAGVELHNKAET